MQSQTPRVRAGSLIRTVLVPSAIAITASWATLAWLFGSLESGIGPGVFTNEIAAGIILFAQAGAIFTANWKALSGKRSTHLLLGALALWALISIGWSANKSYALLELILVVTCTLSFVAIASRVGSAAMFLGLLIGTQIIVLLVYLSREADFKDGGFLLYPGKLAPLLLIGICISLGTLLSSPPSLGSGRLIKIGALIILGVDASALFHSESETGKFVLFLIGIIGVAFIGARVGKSQQTTRTSIERILSVVVLMILGTTFLMMRFTPPRVFGVNIETSFTGRKVLWAAAWEGTLQRPWTGWGWVSAWFDPTFRNDVLPLIGDRAPRFYWSHSTWLDIGLSVGLIGLLVIFVVFTRVILSAKWFRNQSLAIAMFLVCALSIQLMFESFHRDMHLTFATLLFAILVLNGTFDDVT